ncbi:MAG: flagellar basal body P-ring formation chaperone FlgA, partial [Melioribacteraceae bacterium]|nr:flagellar basal body P-ring formation chaperone FlgA [Melioribacteraceae bacterium]
MKYTINIFILLLLINTNLFSIDVEKYLNERLKNYSKISYNIISPKSLDLSGCKIDNSRELKISKDLAYLPVIISKNGEIKHSFITLRVKLYKAVLVANKPIRKNQYLSKTDFNIINKEISRLRFEPTETSLNLLNYRSRLNIKENTILQNGMIEKIPDIETGDRIEAVYNNNSLNIKFKVTARSEGTAGSIIRV